MEEDDDGAGAAVGFEIALQPGELVILDTGQEEVAPAWINPQNLMRVESDEVEAVDVEAVRRALPERRLASTVKLLEQRLP